MKLVDKLLQAWRFEVVQPYVPRGSRLLDIGCADGALRFRMTHKGVDYTGIDPDLDDSGLGDHWRLIKSTFPTPQISGEEFEVVTMLALLEHIPAEGQRSIAAECHDLLGPGGLVVLTVPSALVDKALRLLVLLRAIDGMHLEQHYGFDPGRIPLLFKQADFHLLLSKRFQLGFNHLFVFERRP